MSNTASEQQSAFKAYDIRGRVPEQIDAKFAYRVGAFYAQVLAPQRVAVGHDIRLSSPELSQAIIAGLVAAGVDVVDIGLCGTEEVYYAVGHGKLDGGLMVTASHNPANYNGIKMVGRDARPIGRAEGLTKISELVLSGDSCPIAIKPGSVTKCSVHQEYARFLLSHFRLENFPPASFKVVCNAGNGGAALVLEQLAAYLNFELIVVDGEPDGSFPHGVPNPLLPDKRALTSQSVVEHRADFGAAWDGDFDRCFFFDERGRFLEGYYLVSLFARHFLQQHPGAKIVHDPRLTWNTLDIVQRCGGQTVMCKTGHAFIKQCMRSEQAVYGGEMSAHHYFQDFFYCDSGMMPWLVMLEILGSGKMSLSSLVDEMMLAYPVSGEINRRVQEPASAIAERVLQLCLSQYGKPIATDHTDGLSLEYSDFRFNLRSSNTEPLLRLNVETRANQDLLKQVTRQLLEAIGGQPQ